MELDEWEEAPDPETTVSYGQPPVLPVESPGDEKSAAGDESSTP